MLNGHVAPANPTRARLASLHDLAHLFKLRQRNQRRRIPIEMPPGYG